MLVDPDKLTIDYKKIIVQPFTKDYAQLLWDNHLLLGCKILVWRDQVVKGHMTVMAAKMLGIGFIEVHRDH